MSSDFESRVRETGLRLYQLIEGETPSIFKKEFWTGKVMEWSMKNEDFKVRLFRFIDVFPCLIRPESVAKHLVEYLSGAEHNIPAAFQFGLKHIDPTSMAGKMLAKSIANNIKRMGKHR